MVEYEYPQNAVRYFEKELGKSFLRTTDISIGELSPSKSIFTTFDSDSHGGADARVYTSPLFYQWLLSKSRNSIQRID